MDDYKTIPERADELFRRMETVLDGYEEEFDRLEREDELTAEFSGDMLAAEYNISRIEALCELDPVGFVDTYADITDMDDTEVFHEILVKGKGLE